MYDYINTPEVGTSVAFEYPEMHPYFALAICLNLSLYVF